MVWHHIVKLFNALNTLFQYISIIFTHFIILIIIFFKCIYSLQKYFRIQVSLFTNIDWCFDLTNDFILPQRVLLAHQFHFSIGEGTNPPKVFIWCLFSPQLTLTLMCGGATGMPICYFTRECLIRTLRSYQRKVEWVLCVRKLRTSRCKFLLRP